jgi:hypothetical protein
LADFTLAVLCVVEQVWKSVIMKAQDYSFIRIVSFVLGTFCSLYVLRTLHWGEISVPVDKNTPVLITQTSDPALYWGLVIFMSLMAVILFYATFFAKNGSK